MIIILYIQYIKMASKVVKCINKSGDLQKGAYSVTNSIRSHTTPLQFDAICEEHPYYKIEFGGRCGWNALGTAAYKGNCELVDHIVKKYGEHLIELGNGFGWSPLYCACNCEDIENGYLVGKLLIELGANVNLATSTCCDDSVIGDTYAGSTPLWACIEKTKNIKLAKLLINNGGIAENLSKEGKKLLDTLN